MAKKPTKPPKPAPIGFGRRQMPDEAGDTPPRRKASHDLTEEDFAPDEEDDSPTPGPEDFSDPNFDVLMEEIGKRFEVANSLDEAGLQLTTKQVHERLQAFYPSLFYGVQSVFNALKKLGFTYDDPYKNMNFVWLFK
ncbi:MAG: hypothetical protein ACRYFZ_16045 [Janthinobacterium lividum]